MRRPALARLACAAALLALAAPASAQESHLLVIVGLGGDRENTERFHGWATALIDAARDRYGLSEERVVYLGEDTALDPERMDGRATRDAIEAAAARLARQTRPGDRVFIVLFGHGASATGEARFNLPGPDLSARDFARLVERFGAQVLAFVNTASASGPFVPALAGRDRTVITATKTEGERNQTRFGEFFVEALASADGDLDKDGRVSLFEAFTWARRRVVESYEKDGQLLTEHAVLDDDGDGKGSEAPGVPPATDGMLARTLFLAAGDAGRAAAEATADPELRALYAQRKGIEARIAALTTSKAKMGEADYEREMEQLLIELAQTNRTIREKEKKK